MKRVLRIMVLLIAFLVIGSFFAFSYFTSPVDKKNNKEIEFTIKQGMSTQEIAKELKKDGLIKNDLFFSIYVKLTTKDTIKAATFKLKKSMNVNDIIKVITSNNGYNKDEVSLTFKEGYNIRNYVSVITKSTNIKEKDIYKKLKDKDYLNELIDKYWFLTKDIKNKDLYYSLEGYLFPDTYMINVKEDTIEIIIDKFLKRTDDVLSKYKDEIIKSKLSVHEILTMASIIEKEGKAKDFKNIASVFYNRINDGMKLQSCATSYYGIKKDFDETGIATNEMIYDNNKYNTYNVIGLPVGPISMPSIEAIEAVLFPNNTNYFYFLSDNTNKTYFFRYDYEHAQKQQELINEGKWYR